MYRRQECGGWVEEEWETVDPDVLDDSLAKLTFWTGTITDALWQHFIEIDPNELLENREKQKVALARYARQSLLQWNDVKVSQIRTWFRLLKELIEAEHAVQSVTEEG